MTIRTTTLGGTNWASNEDLTSSDLNDTMNEMANFAKTLSGFWLNPNLRTLFDNFDSYTTGADITSANWVFTDDPTNPSNTSFTASATTYAGGSTKEGLLNATYPTSGGARIAKVSTSGLVANKNTFIKIAVVLNDASSAGHDMARISFDGESTTHNIISTMSQASSSYDLNVSSIILIVAKGSNEYDCYINGALKQTVTDATFAVTFIVEAPAVNNCYSQIYIDDVYQSEGTM